MSAVIVLSDSDDEPCQKKIKYSKSVQSVPIQLDSDSDLEDVVGEWANLNSNNNKWTQECPICCDDVPNGEMVHCLSGHEVCARCLKCYAQEAITGNGKASLPCMLIEGCQKSYSRAQRLVALTVQQYKQLDEREQQESLRLADIDDLVTCPFCQFSAILSHTQIFDCLKCKKQSCKLCQVVWTEHVGKTCDEIEKTDEASLRKEYEEKMTLARVRYCPRCKQPLIKESGCNKMMCKCGTNFCYICSQQGNYDHFCKCTRKVVGSTCSVCRKCVLHTDVEKLDENNIRELQQQAGRAQKDGGLRQRAVGVSTSTSTESTSNFNSLNNPQRMRDLVNHQNDFYNEYLDRQQELMRELMAAKTARKRKLNEARLRRQLRQEEMALDRAMLLMRNRQAEADSRPVTS